MRQFLKQNILFWELVHIFNITSDDLTPVAKVNALFLYLIAWHGNHLNKLIQIWRQEKYAQVAFEQKYFI